METVFLTFLNRSITASWLVLVVILIRFLLKKSPKGIRCILWIFVGIRFICPFSFESVLSLIPNAQTIHPDIVYSQTPAINTGIPAMNNIVNPIISKSFAPSAGASANPLQIYTFIASIVWITGILLMALYAAINYFKLYRKVREGVELKDHIWLCDYIDTPFILGIIRPRIFLPSVIKQQQMEYVIAHEKAHLARHDHWWKPLGFLLLTLYWFNPLCWIAYYLLCKDIELACDEKVIKNFDIHNKKAYSEALLNCSVTHHTIAACPLAFGEVSVKERIQTVLNYKKPTFRILITAVLVCIIVGICFLTNPKEEKLFAFEPFGRNYYVEEIVYEAPQYSFGFTLDTAPRYCLTEDGQLMETFIPQLSNQEKTAEWISKGKAEKIVLTQDNFDFYLDHRGINISSNFSASVLRTKNEMAWKVTPSNTSIQEFYYILKQSNKEMYLVYGYDTSIIRWIFKLNTEATQAKQKGIPELVNPTTTESSAEDRTEPEEVSEEKLSDLLNVIISSPMESSIPSDYIKEHQTEYESLLAYGEDTLKYCYTEFLKGEQTDLRGHIMANVCKDIIESDGETYPEDNTNLTGQDWFNNFLHHADILQQQYSQEEFKELYPAAWLLLQIK